MSEKEEKLLILNSEKEDSRYVPVHIARPLLQECGYRCSVPRCRGTSALQLEHIEDWAKLDFKKHDFHKMIVLCATCHARVTAREIHKDAVRAYKRNLAVINGRYSLFEMRLLEAFHENQTSIKSKEVYAFNMDSSESELSIEKVNVGAKERISRTDILHIKGLIDDGLVKTKDSDIAITVGTYSMAPVEVSLTENGSLFLHNYFSGKEVTEEICV